MDKEGQQARRQPYAQLNQNGAATGQKLYKDSNQLVNANNKNQLEAGPR